MNVIISPNIKRQKAMVDMQGNEVVPFTHQIIRDANEGNYIPTQAEREALEAKSVGIDMEIPPGQSVGTTAPEGAPIRMPVSPLTIQQQIDAAKENLARLEELKKLKIQEMEAQLEMLKSE